jgi:type VII secretion-associated serine protease mycosin
VRPAIRRLVAGVVVGCGLVPLAPVVAWAGPGNAAGPDQLPKITPRLASGSGCVPASTLTVDATPWPVRMLRPESAWRLSQGDGVTVAVVDTGVDATRVPALAGRVDPGVDVVNPGNAGTDCIGHGTFVAGLVAAASQAGSPFAGIAPHARILAIRATDAVGNTNAAVLAAGIRAAVDRHATVITVSPGVPVADDGLHQAVRYAVEHGALVVAPSTVDGASQPGPSYPAGFPETLAVGGIDANGARSEPAGARVDLVAPATSVVSVGPGGDGHFTGTGASLAAAFVAGTAALVTTYHPGLSVAGLVSRLKASAYRVGAAVPDPEYGYGIVDPAGAVGALLPAQGTPTGAPASALRMPPVVGQPERPVAFTVAGGLLAVLALVGVGLLVRPSGRRRAWRPGG